MLAAPLALIPLLSWILPSPDAWVTLFFAVALLAPPLPIAFGNSGPHPALIFAALGVVVGFLRLDEWRFRRGLLPATLILFFAMLAISVGPAALYSGPEIALQTLARAGLAGISVWVFFYVAMGPGRAGSIPIHRIYWIALASAGFACLDFYYQFPAPAGFGAQYIWLDSGVYRRAQGLFYEASALGNFCAFFLVMTAVALVRGAANRAVLLAGGAVFAAALMFSYSRSSVANVAIAIAVLAVMERKRPAVRKAAMLAAGSLVVLGIVLYRYFPAYAGLYWVRLQASVTYALSSNEVVLSGRAESWRVLGQFLLEHPWHALLGVGYKTLPYSDFIGQRVGGPGSAELCDCAGGVSRGAFGRRQKIVLRDLDFLLLDCGGRANDVRRSADVLAGASFVFVGTGDGCAAMRILFLEQFGEVGGGQRNLLDLLPAVRERGWTAVVAAPGDGELLEKARAEGAETASIEFGNYSLGRKTAGDALQFAFDTARLRRFVAQADCDLISVGGARLLPGVAMGAGRRPVVFQAQHYLGDSTSLRVALRAIRHVGATVIGNSRHVAGPFGSDVPVVYNGVAEIAFGTRPGKRRIGIIGRIAPMKGQVDFLLAARHIPDATFVICGAPMFCPDSYLAEVYKCAEGLRVEFLGWQEDVGTVLAGLDLLVVPSTEAEATTRVILEAFSAGVPVVAYASGGIPEVVRDGENGFLVGDGDTSGPACWRARLGARIVEILGMDLTGVVKRARADFEERFTVERYREEMLEVYERVWNHQRIPSQMVGTNSRM
jgi:hypothetical protein